MSKTQIFSEKEITKEDALASGLSEEEYERIRSLLGGKQVSQNWVYTALFGLSTAPIKILSVS